MDNAQEVATTAPQGQADATVQAPSTSSGENPQNSAEGAGQAQTQEGQSGQAKEGFVMPEKFNGKTAEEIAQAYVNLESHNKKVEMQKSEIEKLFTQEQPENKEVSQPEQTDVNDDLAVAEQKSSVIKSEVSKLLSPVIAKLEVQDMINKYGDAFVAVAKDVKRIKDEKNISMEDAFKLATYPTVERTSFNQGIQKANEVQVQKQKAVVESSRPSGYRPTTLDDAVNNAKTNEELAEIFEAAGPEYKKFAEYSRQFTGGKLK